MSLTARPDTQWDKASRLHQRFLLSCGLHANRHLDDSPYTLLCSPIFRNILTPSKNGAEIRGSLMGFVSSQQSQRRFQDVASKSANPDVSRDAADSIKAEWVDGEL